MNCCHQSRSFVMKRRKRNGAEEMAVRTSKVAERLADSMSYKE